MTNPSNDIPALRYNRFGGGYRREDVETALQQMLLTMRAVETDLDHIRARSTELEGELQAAQHEIESYRAREESLLDLIERAEELLARVERRTGTQPTSTGA